MISRDSRQFLSCIVSAAAVVTLISFVSALPNALAAEEDKSAGAVSDTSETSDAMPTEMSESGVATASSRPPLEGKTEVTELLLDEHPLYQQAMAAIDKEEYGRAVGYLQEMTAQLGEGYEPYKAECMYYEAGCHQMLNRMNAATDMYKKAFELFEKFDAQNPLKGKAWNQYFSLKHQKGSLDQPKLTGNVEQQNVTLRPQKALIAIDPNAVLEVRDNNRDIPILDVNDKTVLPLIVKECFSDMTCLETAEIGSNVTNADKRWMPLMVHGRAAAFGMDGSANPTFRAKVNGRSYLFDVILPDLGEGVRKILLVTNQEKICAVDVNTFDTWLLRMGRAKDGRIISARWYKLTHKKITQPVTSPASNPQKFRHPNSRRNF
jgi:hypothetical protein